MSNRVISCSTPPERGPFTELLKEYYALMVARIEADGGFAGDGSKAIEEFWDEVDKFMPPDGRLFLAENGAGDMIGCGMMKKIGPDVAELKRLYVTPSARSTGLGRQLVERRIMAAQEMGVKTLLVDTLKANVEMQGLYRSLGFEEIDGYSESSTVKMVPELMPLMVFFKMEL